MSVTTTLLLQFLTFLINSVFGIIVLRANTKSHLNRLYSIFSFALAMWNISLFCTILAAPGQLIWSRAAFSFGSIMFATLFYFIFFFNRKSTRIPWIPHILVAFPAAILFLVSFTPLMVKSVLVQGSFITGELGPFMMVYTIFVVLLVITSFIFAIVRYFQAKGMTKVQLGYVLLGMGFFFITFLTTNLILPVFFGIFSFNNLGPIFSIPMVVAIGYAIVKFHLMDIRVLLTRSMTFSALFVVFMSFFTYGLTTLELYWSKPLASFVTAALVVVLFSPLKKLFENITESIFFSKQFRFEDIMLEVGQTLSQTFNLNVLVDSISGRMKEYLKVSRVSFAFFEEEGEHKDPALQYVDETHPLARYFIEKSSNHSEEILDREELRLHVHTEEDATVEEIVSFLDSSGYAIAAPIFVKKRLIGAVFLGEKLSNEPFFSSDIKIIDFIIHQIAFSVENARAIKLLSELDEDKTEFINVVSHQMRTPLSAARWNIENILSENSNSLSDEEKRGLITSIYEKLGFLNDDLNNLITALELSEKKVGMKKEKLDFNKKIFSPVMAEIKKHPETNTISFVSSIEKDMEVCADQQKLYTILRTLLLNAVTYGPRNGTVFVSAEIKDSNLIVRVEDEGEGIDTQTKEAIFSRFYRGIEAKRISPDGLGLSLYIANEFAHIHGGELSVENRKNGKHGACFVLSIPVK